MHAVTIERQKFITEEIAQDAFERLQNEDNPWRRPFNSTIVGREIFLFFYEGVSPYELDNLFYNQMNSMDSKLATGAKKRSSKNGYDAPLMDYDDEEGE